MDVDREIVPACRCGQCKCYLAGGCVVHLLAERCVVDFERRLIDEVGGF